MLEQVTEFLLLPCGLQNQAVSLDFDPAPWGLIF